VEETSVDDQQTLALGRYHDALDKIELLLARRQAAASRIVELLAPSQRHPIEGYVLPVSIKPAWDSLEDLESVESELAALVDTANENAAVCRKPAIKYSEPR
jgi:hypothetical protein